MRNVILATLAAFTLLGAGCTAGAPDASASDDSAPQVDDQDVSTGYAVSALTASAVAPGCAASVNCTGAKTCGPWSAYATCGATFSACRDDCGFQTRHGCVTPATLTPQNRSRSCVINATGQACTEIDYRELESCPIQ